MGLVGSSFRTTGVAERERIARRLRRFIESGSTRLGPGLLELAPVETCNRLELYFVSNSPSDVADAVVSALRGSDSGSQFYVRQGRDAISHLFRVAAGLDSPVMGEEQILEQVREAGRTARTSGSAKSALSSLFDAACSSGSRVRGSYKVPLASGSVSAFALKHALRSFEKPPTGVLLIGSGETAKLAALKLKGSKVYLLSSRRGAEARFPGAIRVSRRKLREAAGECDLIIAATRRHGYSLTRRDLPKDKRVVILDLGFPRNVDPSVGSSKLVKLYDLDSVAAWARSRRSKIDPSSEKLVEEEARRFDAWVTASRLTPTLANIYRWGERVRREETVAALRRLPELSPHAKEVVESLTRRLTGKLLSPHAAFAKDADGRASQSDRLVLLESIFKEGS